MTSTENELKHQRVRVVIVAVVLVVFTVNMFAGGDDPRAGLSGTGLALSAITVACVAAFLVAVHPPLSAPALPVAGFAASIAAAIGLYLLAPQRPSQIMLYLVIAAAAALLPTRESAAVAVLAVAGYASVILSTGRGADQLWTIVSMAAVYVAVVAGRNRKRTRRIEQENLVLAERARIAREIHDILAHTLSAQLVHLEGAKLLAGAGRADEAVDRIERARELARGGLSETRRALETLRGENLEVDAALRELAAQHHEAGGGTCEVVIEARAGELPAEAGLALVRTAQEALTNIRKHAPGADTAITLRSDGEVLVLEVADTGGGTEASDATGTGYGLVGMRERAELIGGTLEAGPRGEGFAVVLRVPS